MGFEENFMQSFFIVFFFFFGNIKAIFNFKRWFAKLWFMCLDVVDVFKKGGSFGSCSAWEGANGLPRGRLCLRGLGDRGNYAN